MKPLHEVNLIILSHKGTFDEHEPRVVVTKKKRTVVFVKSVYIGQSLSLFSNFLQKQREKTTLMLLLLSQISPPKRGLF